MKSTNRNKEERMLKRLKDPDENRDDNIGISRLIDKTLRSKHKVYLTTDWHLWLRNEKDKPECHKRSDFTTIINNMNNTITEDDLLINLGDLVDGEFQEASDLKLCMRALQFPKILVRGNNDLFEKSFYKSCGFLYVTDAFTWGDIFFTHIPSDNNCNMNIHGHLHGYCTYWLPYTNQIDVAYLNGRKEPIDLMKVIRSQKEYSKHVKEDVEHFGEQMYGLFDKLNMPYFEDPYHDD